MNKNILKMGLFVACVLLGNSKVFAITAPQYAMQQLESDLHKLLQKAKITGLSAAEKKTVNSKIASLAAYRPKQAETLKKQFENVNVPVTEKVVMPTKEEKQEIEEKREIPILPVPTKPEMIEEVKVVEKQTLPQEAIKFFDTLEIIRDQSHNFARSEYNINKFSADSGYYLYFTKIQTALTDIEKFKELDQYIPLVKDAHNALSNLFGSLCGNLSTLLEDTFGGLFPTNHIEAIKTAKERVTANFLVDFYGPETDEEKTEEQNKHWEEFNSYNALYLTLLTGKINTIFSYVLENKEKIELNESGIGVINLKNSLLKFLFNTKVNSLSHLVMSILEYIQITIDPNDPQKENVQDKEGYKRFFYPLFVALNDYKTFFENFMIFMEEINTVEQNMRIITQKQEEVIVPMFK